MEKFIGILEENIFHGRMKLHLKLSTENMLELFDETLETQYFAEMDAVL